MVGWPVAPGGRTRRAVRLFIALALVLGCGRIGVELSPLDMDAGVPDAAITLPRLCTDPACFLPGCPTDATKTAPGVCGCGRSDAADSDGDGIADCVDFCPGAPDVLESGVCACAAGNLDSDGDGVSNCNELCPFDPLKNAPGLCGCGVAEGGDADADGTPDCDDECPHDANKQEAGACGCGVDERDADLDTIPDCIDACTVANQASYVPQTCGQGYCRANSTPSKCVEGVETQCVPAAQPAQTDPTCDGVDEDCDGAVDDNFETLPTTCGIGVCASTGLRGCDGGHLVDSCVPRAPLSTSDATCDGVDDDCDGATDDDYASSMHACGTGACAALGAFVCAMGTVVDTCVTGAAAASDATCDNRDDDCDGALDEEFVPRTMTCGTGACQVTNFVSACMLGVETTCKAGTAAASDATCNGVDDDCDSRTDENFTVTSSSCGVGACARTGSLTCVGGQTRNSCVAGTPSTTLDDATVPGNGVDDDCDGKVDEDVPACAASTRSYEPGNYTNLTVPGNCRTLTVQLWGGGGASGENAGVSGRGGNGGAGGYATITARLTGTSGPISVYVGTGAASGCDSPGTNVASATYNGGNGGSGAGANGADGVVAGGGAAGTPSSGYAGGRGYYGGGGGGQGKGGLGASGNGGGGGAASVLLVNNARVAVAGGGGGGGGAQSATILGTIASAGGAGGSGCGGAGQVDTSSGGGGGGGGVCQGATVQTGSGVTPAMSGSIPSGRARGGSGSCVAGGAGYAIVTFGP